MLRRSALVVLAASLVIASAQAGKLQPDRTASGRVGVDQGVTKQGDRATYIVRLSDPAVASYAGGTGALRATSPRATGAAKLDAKSAESQAYVAHLRARQDAFLSALRSATRASAEPAQRYFYALNGLALKLTADEAAAVAKMNGVAGVHRNIAYELDTDAGPAWIGAPAVWDGSATGIGAQGEGMVVGIMDSGINQGHPSFAEVGDDGYGAGGEYAATNPFGAGGSSGGPRDDCADPAFPGLCNNKLIGSHAFIDASGGDDFVQPGDPVSKDTDGHGSHVASTSAGNVIIDPPLLDADGNDSGLTLGTVSGVAPHAHIIAYKVCAPSCFASDIAAAIDQAILDGADALNHSIGAAGGSPWIDFKSLAFKGAREAGIMLQNSAGNSGPGAGTAGRISASPWATSVGASTHDRAFPAKQLQDMSGGATAPPADITGRAVTEGFAGTIVYAGDFPVGSPGDANFEQPEQCLDPFPPGTFSGEIVVCDRGSIARVQKARNVRDGGASALVLANVQGGATSTNDDLHVIPAIHINADDGDILRAWLADGGTGHSGTITGSGPAFSDPLAGDIMAGFSSRGPYTNFDILAPHVSAPGVAIYAAGADLAVIDPDNSPSVSAAWGIISGTSMSSPHATGSAALVKQVNPGWSAAEVKSALMTTGTDDMRKEDGVTPADPFDYGGGRVQVDLAAAAGLVMDETIANFDAADPALGGDPSTLNMPDLVSETCTLSCSWTRTVKNVSGGTQSWAVSTTTDSGMVLTASPSSFTLADGATQSIDVSADTTLGVPNGWNFGKVILTPISSRGNGAHPLPEQHLTVAALFSTSSNANALVKSVDTNIASVGQPLAYEIRLTNLSPTDDGPFTLSDTVPAGSTYVAGSAAVALDGGTDITPVAYDGGTNTISWEGTLDTGQVDVISDPGSSPFGYFDLSSIGVEPEPCSSVCDDTFIEFFDLPPFTYAGTTYNDLVVGSNGFVVAGTDTTSAFSNGNQNMPDPTAPNTVLAPFWTDLDLDGTNPDDSGAGRIYMGVFNSGTLIVVEWQGAEVWNVPGPTYTFQLWIATDLSASPGIWFVYHDLAALPPSLSVGAESAGAVLGDTWYFNGAGTAPIIGDAGDLRVVSSFGGSATLTFQAEVTGAIGDNVINVADSSGPDGDETAVAITQIAMLDADNDGVEDFADNCTLTPNPSQCDSDADNYGNHCDADFNNSGFVNFGDLGLFRVGFFDDSMPPDYNELDLNCDSMINFTDLMLFKELFGTEPGPSQPAE